MKVEPHSTALQSAAIKSGRVSPVTRTRMPSNRPDMAAPPGPPKTLSIVTRTSASATSAAEASTAREVLMWRIVSLRRYGAPGGGMRRFVACSNAYASRSRVGSLQAIPVNDTPKGCAFASKPSGNGTTGAFGTSPNGTITVG